MKYVISYSRRHWIYPSVWHWFWRENCTRTRSDMLQTTDIGSKFMD